MEEITTEAIVQKKSKKPLVIGGILLAVLLAGYISLCAVAANTTVIYPNRTMRGIDVGGLTVSEAAQKLEAEFPKQVFTLQPSAQETDRVMDPIPLPYAALGATLDYETAARVAHKDFDAGNFFSNGWEYGLSLLGQAKDNTWCSLTLDDGAFRAGVLRLTDTLSFAPQDATYALEENAVLVTAAMDGQKIAVQPEGEAFETALRRQLETMETMEVSVEILPAKGLTAQELQSELAGEMKNAGYDPATKSITPERIGGTLDVPAAQALLDGAAPGETVEIPAELQFPTVTAEALKALLFRDVLGTYTTHVGGSKGRIGNVRLSAEKVDGFIMNAGEIFSYNDVVGERTAANGYQPAPAYVKGETVDEIGGGICQTSSTLYFAALRANLQIVERYAHRYAPAYIPWGMDATVSWGGPEFRFSNDTDYPVKLVASLSKKNYLTITVYGTKTQDFTVKMTSKVLSDTPFEIIRQDDPTLAPGTETVKVTPYTGHKVESYRNVYDGDGKLLSSTLEAVSNYKSRDKVILVGPAIVTETPVEIVPGTPGETPPGTAGELPAGGEAAIPAPPELPAEPAAPVEPGIPPAA